MTSIELQTRRLSIITSLMELDEESLSLLESYIQCLNRKGKQTTHEMSYELLIAFAQRAKENFKNEDYITQKELEEEIEAW
ncbi:hypothetical protein [Parabacteroides sp.]